MEAINCEFHNVDAQHMTKLIRYKIKDTHTNTPNIIMVFLQSSMRVLFHTNLMKGVPSRAIGRLLATIA